MLEEPDAAAYLARLKATEGAKLSGASYVETALKLIELGYADPAGDIDAAIAAFRLVFAPVDRAQARVAVEARLLFGKGRHPAALNYGDCFAYALAKVTGEPLLYKGEDFARTDVVSAL